MNRPEGTLALYGGKETRTETINLIILIIYIVKVFSSGFISFLLLSRSFLRMGDGADYSVIWLPPRLEGVSGPLGLYPFVGATPS